MSAPAGTTAAPEPSYSHGISSTALIGETIGDNLPRDGGGVRRERGAGRRADRAALDLRPARLRHRRAGPGLIWPTRERATGSGSGRPTAPNGLCCSTRRPRSRHPGHINPAYRSHELSFVLGQSGVRMLVSAESFKTSDYRAMSRRSRRPCPAWSRSSTWAPTAGTTWSRRRRGAGQLARGPGPAAAELAFDDPINIQYTSGTTGFPKGATLSHHNILNNGFFIGEGCQYTPADRVCIPVPFYIASGCAGHLACTTHGACIVIPAPGFDPAARCGPWPPSTARRCTGCRPCSFAELALPDFSQHDLSSLRTGIMAGSPCPSRS